MKLYPEPKIKVIGPAIFHSVFINTRHVFISAVMHLWIIEMWKGEVCVRPFVFSIHYSSGFIHGSFNISLDRVTLDNALEFHHSRKYRRSSTY